MKKYCYLLICTVLLSSCFKDKGNYDYVDINEIEIGNHGFTDTIYNLRADVDMLTIKPEIRSSLDPDFSGGYSYEWVAVGNNLLKGERFVLGNEKNLSYEVKLPAESYILYLKITDKSSEIVFSKSVDMNVSSLYTKGWAIGGETAGGYTTADMISISRDTIIAKNVIKNRDNIKTKGTKLIWVDNNPYSYDNLLFVSSPDGTYKYDRETFIGGENTNLVYSFTNKEYFTQGYITDLQQISDKRRIVIADGHVYDVSMQNEGLFGNPINRTEDSYIPFPVGEKAACNHLQKDVRYFVFYNTQEKRFYYIKNFGICMYPVKDTDTDISIYKWQTGMDYITTINSFFGTGESCTILKDPSDNKLYAYTYTVGRSGTITKGGKYPLSGATGIDNAGNIIMTTKQGYLLYSAGSKLYGYDFRGSNRSVLLKDFGNVEITLLHNDILSSEKDQDYFYIATYGGTENSGEIYKYQMADSPDAISFAKTDLVRWKGLCKVKSMCFKEF